MKTWIANLLLGTVLLSGAQGESLTTAFSYHGQLNLGGQPAEGTYNLRFKLFESPVASAPIIGPANVLDLPVHGGVFTATLDFGSAFDGRDRWLEISVRPSGSGDEYTTLTPRQLLMPTPYAIYAGTAGNLAAGSYPAAITLGNAGNTIVGNGAGLTELNASTLSTGVIPEARLGPEVARLPQVMLIVFGNDGPGSSLDADLLDGLDSSAFARAAHSHPGAGHGSTLFGVGDNFSAGLYSTVSGGFNNRSDGADSTVPGGAYNIAAGRSSFAAGNTARALHDGCFVWADYSDPENPDFSYQSTAPNQFCVRALGGMHLSGRTSQFFGNTTRQMLNLWTTDFGIGVQADTLYQRSNWRFSWYRGGTHAETQNDPGGGVVMMTLDPAGLTVNGTFVNSSDRNTKENFSTVDPMAVLDQVAKLPISRWNYKEDPATRHIGPMAQDFHAAFGVGPDDKHIATVDADGVALAALQALNQKVQEVGALEERVRSLEAKAAMMDNLLQRIKALESFGVTTSATTK